jgi:uncharacterized membrane protein
MYLLLKLIHIAAVVVFLGNISLGIFWKRLADGTRKPDYMAHTIGGIIRADRLFTIPGVVVLVLAGIGTALVGGIPLLGTGWVLWGIVLISVSGLAFIPVGRAQPRLLALAEGGLTTEAELAEYRAHSHTWDVWGTVSLIAPVLALVVMVLKPNLPAFHF